MDKGDGTIVCGISAAPVVEEGVVEGCRWGEAVVVVALDTFLPDGSSVDCGTRICSYNIDGKGLREMPRFLIVRHGESEGCDYTLDCNIAYSLVSAASLDDVRERVIKEERENEFCNTSQYGLREIKIYRVEDEVVVDIAEIAEREHRAEIDEQIEKRARARRLLKDAGLEGVPE